MENSFQKNKLESFKIQSKGNGLALVSFVVVSLLSKGCLSGA